MDQSDEIAGLRADALITAVANVLADHPGADYRDLARLVLAVVFPEPEPLPQS